jgi:hypothetical protein
LYAIKKKSTLKFIYKKSNTDELEFIDSILKPRKSKLDLMDEHQMIDYLTSNPNFDHRNNLIFYHWYERVYKKNVINENVLSGLNKSNSYISKRTLKDDIIDRINEHMNSSRFLGFTVYYEYYYDFFIGIEKFSYEEFKNKIFLLYILDLFPQIVEIDYKSQKRFFRFNSTELKKLPYEYNSFVVYYKSNNLPTFYPHKLNEVHTYTPHSLLTKSKKDIANVVRVEKGLPKIGEGWISETLLYYAVAEALPEYNVIHHGSTEWLGLQHLDIFIPNLNIGIEYQGKQHTEPIEFFGGVEAFEKNLERDKRKKRLCSENDLKLFYVFPETDTVEFITELKEYIKTAYNNS